MLLNDKIPSAPETDPALDPRQLQAIGLEHIRSLSRRLWTDHNLHDPGITILEQLSYALTDLAYRASFPIEDLLAAPKDDNGDKRQFYTPRQILPNRPLTLNDYRKLVIDMDYVKNAWILPVEERHFFDLPRKKWLKHGDLPGEPLPKGVHEVGLRGLYEVLIEAEPFTEEQEHESEAEEALTGSGEAKHPRTLDELKEQVMETLQANRNLCEDFVGVKTVQDQYYTLCTEIEVAQEADQHEVAARIQFEIENYLSPPVVNNTLAEMLARTHEDGSPYTVAEIFDGPLLRHGFIDDTELEKADLRTEIRLSDIINIIMDIEGVKAVRDIVVNPLIPGDNPEDQPEQPADKWRIKVPRGRQPRLSGQKGRLLCFKRNVPAMLEADKFNAALQRLKDAQTAKLDRDLEEDIPVPAGRHRNTGTYRSFQHHFPELYGLSEYGLPTGSDAQREISSLQLKAYLLFFDQVMSNYLAQLSNVHELFSLRPSVDATYFGGMVKTFPDAARVYADKVSDAELAAMLESGDAALSRRNRFLDHLLSRVAENFHHYTGIMRSFPTDHSKALTEEDIVAMKYSFLNAYPTLGSERSLACNYTLQDEKNLWNSANVSGLERRIARLLDIRNFSRRTLSTVPHDLYPEIDLTPGNEFRFRIKHAITGKILLSSSKNYTSEEKTRDKMNEAVKMARAQKNYRRKTTHDGKQYFFNIVNADGEVVARRIEYFDTEEAMNAAIETLIDFMKLYQEETGEGMYLIENILLRPQMPDDPFMPVCVDPNCTDCAELDTYSYRVHFILPAYAGRFQNMEFRRFAEETIRTETPAHILPKICWVSADEMAMVESAYRDFVALAAGANTSNRTAKLTALLDALTCAKNIYPSQPLQGCSSITDAKPFMLGLSALGGKTADSSTSPDRKE